VALKSLPEGAQRESFPCTCAPAHQNNFYTWYVPKTMIQDLIIIGGGPSGINVAISAKKAGLNYLILEKGMVSNSLFNFPVNMTFFSTSLKLEIHNIPFISHRDKPTRSEALEYYRRLIQSQDLKISLYEEVRKMHLHHRNLKGPAPNPRHLRSHRLLRHARFNERIRRRTAQGEALLRRSSRLH
jgi:glycine/D-amino acid oxidase-like deaminating enzyme